MTAQAVALPRSVAARTGVVDGLLFATVFAVTFASVRWTIAGSDVNISDVTATLFVVGFLSGRFTRRDWGMPPTALVLAGFFLAFTVVYLVGFFNLGTTVDRALFLKGLAKFLVHFAFLICAVAHIARRPPRFFWKVLAWFVAGLALNATYGAAELASAEIAGINLDERVLTPIGSYQRGGINVFGAVQGAAVYRTNALTLDPNHLSIMLLVPLLVLLPVYLRLERGHRLRTPLALLLGFLFLVDLSTLSRSGFLGLFVGFLVLAFPYRHLLLSKRFLVPLGGVALVLGVIVLQRTNFFETVLHARTSVSGGSVRVHLDIYRLVPPVIGEHPLFGLGLNTFSTYYEFVTGKTNWGPHSYYIALLSETGIVGTALFLVYLVYLFQRLAVLRELGRVLAARGDQLSRSVRPLAWGLTAALLGTLAANAFYLTMQFYYFFVLAMLVLAAPVVFARRR